MPNLLDDVLQQAFARTVGLGAVSGQELQHGAVRHQRQREDEQQQHERHQPGEDARGREVYVPLLGVVGGVEHVEAAFAEKAALPCPYVL